MIGRAYLCLIVIAAALILMPAGCNEQKRDPTEVDLAKTETAMRDCLCSKYKYMEPDELTRTLGPAIREGEDLWVLGQWTLRPIPGGYLVQLSEPVYEGKKEAEVFLTTVTLRRTDDRIVVDNVTRKFVLLHRQ